MPLKRYLTKNNLSKAGNVLFIALMLLLLLSPDAKAWFLRQLVTVGLFKAEIKNETAVAKAAPAPLLQFRNERGELLSTEELKGKVVFINFWATWCPPCRAEMPSLQELYNELKNDNRIIFLFVNEDDDAAKAKNFLQSKQYSFPLSFREGRIPADIYSGTLPTTIVLNKEGNVVFRHEGLASYNSAEFIKQLKELL